MGAGLELQKGRFWQRWKAKDPEQAKHKRRLEPSTSENWELPNIGGQRRPTSLEYHTQ